METGSQTPLSGAEGTRARERELARLATRQHGVVAQRQLLAIGFSERAIKLRMDAGRLNAIHREVYAVGHSRVSRNGYWLGAVLAYGDLALLSHRTAAALWELARPDSTPIDVSAPVGRQGLRRRQRIWIHRGKLHPEDRAERAGIPVTSVARTLFDYAEVVDFQRLERAWEEADRLKRLRLSEIERVCERGYGRRALKPTRLLLGQVRASIRTRSPLEDRFQCFARFHDLPPHCTNVDVFGSEVDVLWPAAMLIVELDSWEFHGHRAAFQRDRARDARLLVAGYRTVRVTHYRLDNEADTLADEIRGLLRTRVVPSDGTVQP